MRNDKKTFNKLLIKTRSCLFLTIILMANVLWCCNCGSESNVGTSRNKVHFYFSMGNPDITEDWTFFIETGDSGSISGDRSWKYKVILWKNINEHNIEFIMQGAGENDIVYFKNGIADFSGFASYMTTFYGYLEVVE